MDFLNFRRFALLVIASIGSILILSIGSASAQNYLTEGLLHTWQFDSDDRYLGPCKISGVFRSPDSRTYDGGMIAIYHDIKQTDKIRFTILLLRNSNADTFKQSSGTQAEVLFDGLNEVRFPMFVETVGNVDLVTGFLPEHFPLKYFTTGKNIDISIIGVISIRHHLKGTMSAVRSFFDCTEKYGGRFKSGSGIYEHDKATENIPLRYRGSYSIGSEGCGTLTVTGRRLSERSLVCVFDGKEADVDGEYFEFSCNRELPEELSMLSSGFWILDGNTLYIEKGGNALVYQKCN